MPVLVSGMLKIAAAGQFDKFQSALFSFVIARDPKDMRCVGRNIITNFVLLAVSPN